MLNLLSYIGVNLQSELCLWTLLGLLRTIFDATLFKVNSNLKQVWQMSMPPELSMPVQRGLRTMISGVMLVQCFTVYVYLATYIVLLYPVFLEERPNLLLPWLLLAAIRKFLCELMSLALGLGTCVLLGPARPPCIKFVVFKIASITPAFYMWMLVLSYYNTLKVAAAFKRFPAVIQSSDHDYGLELAVRRRRTKSLQDEEQLRRKLVASLYVLRSYQHIAVQTKHEPNSEECMRRNISREMHELSLKRNNYGERTSITTQPRLKPEVTSRMAHTPHVEFEDMKADVEAAIFLPAIIPGPTDGMMSDLGTYEDWCGSEMIVPRDADRILEQFSIMMLRIGSFLTIEGSNVIKRFTSHTDLEQPLNNLGCSTMHNQISETPSLVGSSRQNPAAYLQDYPQIFKKKPLETLPLTTDGQLFTSSESASPSKILSNEINDNNLTSLSPKRSLENVDINCITLNRTSSFEKYLSNEASGNQDKNTMESGIYHNSEVHNSTEQLRIHSIESQFRNENLDSEQLGNSLTSRDDTNKKQTILPSEELTIFTVDLDNKPEIETTTSERDTKQFDERIKDQPEDENTTRPEEAIHETENPTSTQTIERSSTKDRESKKER